MGDTMRFRVLLISAAFACLGRCLVAQTALPGPERALARNILQQLVEIVTTDSAGNTPAAAQAMAARLIDAGFPPDDVRQLNLNPRVGTLVARLRGVNPHLRPILLIAHLDVVSARREDWSVDPWTLVERDGWFYGRGVHDDKGGVAMLIATLIRLRREAWHPERDIIIALSGDEEETAARSLAWLLTDHRELVDAEFALNFDAGDLVQRAGRSLKFFIQTSEKTYADFGLEATDSGGHSSLPRPGNPINVVAGALVRLANYPFPVRLDESSRLFLQRSARLESGQLAADLRAASVPSRDTAALTRLLAYPSYAARLRTTCVATRVEGGHANNALPQHAHAVVNCRILPGDSASEVEATLRRLAGDSVTLAVIEPPVSAPPSPYSAAVTAPIERLVAEFWPGVPVIPDMDPAASDGLFARAAGIPTYGVQPQATDIDDPRDHGKDERTGVESFYDATQFCYRLVKLLAGGNQAR